eukprot:5461996-Pyramimonas_sp.AAC.2
MPVRPASDWPVVKIYPRPASGDRRREGGDARADWSDVAGPVGNARQERGRRSVSCSNQAARNACVHTVPDFRYSPS